MEEKEVQTKETAGAEQIDAQEKEKRKAASRLTLVILGVCMVIILGYVIYGIVSKNVNMLIFEGMMIVFVLLYLFLSDIVEPWKVGLLKDLSANRRKTFLKILGLDVVGACALIYWIVRLDSTSDGVGSIFPLLLYFLCAQTKRKFRAEFEGIASPEPTEETLQTAANESAEELPESAEEPPEAAEEPAEAETSEEEAAPLEAQPEEAEASAASAEEKPE